MAKFQMKQLVGTEPFTARLGAGSGSANYVTDVEIGKPVKLVGDSQYGLCVAGDQIEGVIVAVESYTADDFSIGSVNSEGRFRVILDGSQAAGTGAINVGDYVVMGTVVAKGTSNSGAFKVCKATTQTGMYFAWRVVSLEGTTAVGQYAIIECVSC
jgi:hypothetical protein